MSRTEYTAETIADPDEAAELSALVATVYDAALDPSLWSEAVSGACRFLDCRYGVIGSADLIRAEANFTVTFGYTASAWQDYLDNYFNKNPLNPVAFRSSPGDVLCRDMYPENWQVFEASELYLKWGRPLGIADVIQGTLDKTGSGIAMMSCARHESRGPAGPAEIRRMRLILPHFRRAVLISKTLDVRSLKTAAFAEAIDAISTGVFLVSPQGQLVHANRSGQAMIDAGDPLVLADGALTLADAAAASALGGLFTSALAGEAGTESRGLALPLLGSSGRRFVAHALPLTSGARRAAGEFYSAAIALFVREAKIDTPAVIDAAVRLYGLTPAEERVLRGLIEVEGTAAIASLLGISKSTVKRHMESLFRKTGTRRQAELIGLVAGFGTPLRQSEEQDAAGQGSGAKSRR